jgi:hypothetical protein
MSHQNVERPHSNLEALATSRAEGVVTILWPNDIPRRPLSGWTVIQEGVERSISNVPADPEHDRRLFRLNATDRKILDTVRASRKALKGETIAYKASRNFNSFFKRRLSALRKAGYLSHDGNGYTLGPKAGQVTNG